MKTLINTLVLALTLSSVSFVASANDGKVKPRAAAYQSAVFPAANATTLNVVVQKEGGNRVEVRIKDKRGNVLYTEYLSKKEGSYMAKYNLSDLADGNYRVEITNGSEVTTHDVTLATKSTESVNRNITIF